MAPDARRIRLGELLVRAGVLSEEKLKAALVEQKRWGGKLGSILVQMSFLDEDLLVKALAKQLGLPRAELSGLQIPPEVLETIPSDYAEQKQVLPIAFDKARGEMTVAMADPENLVLVDEIAFRTGYRVRVAIAGEGTLAQAIRSSYFGDSLASGQSDVEEIPLTDQNATTRSTLPVQTLELAPAIEEQLQRLEATQQREIRVLKAIIELLIAKGFISREECRQKVGE